MDPLFESMNADLARIIAKRPDLVADYRLDFPNAVAWLQAGGDGTGEGRTSELHDEIVDFATALEDDVDAHA